MQTYTADPQNVAVAGNVLYIKALKGADGSYTSARLNSRADGGWFPGMTVRAPALVRV